jgi:hypothetical protein
LKRKWQNCSPMCQRLREITGSAQPTPDGIVSSWRAVLGRILWKLKGTLAYIITNVLIWEPIVNPAWGISEFRVVQRRLSRIPASRGLPRRGSLPVLGFVQRVEVLITKLSKESLENVRNHSFHIIVWWNSDRGFKHEVKHCV